MNGLVQCHFIVSPPVFFSPHSRLVDWVYGAPTGALTTSKTSLISTGATFTVHNSLPEHAAAKREVNVRDNVMGSIVDSDHDCGCFRILKQYTSNMVYAGGALVVVSK